MKRRHIPGGDFDGFFVAYHAETVENPIDPRERVWVLPGDHYVITELSTFDGHAHFSSIRSVNKGAGHASTVLDRICALADEYGVSISLAPVPFGNPRGRLNKTQLRAWYARRGFKRLYGDELVRPPKSAG